MACDHAKSSAQLHVLDALAGCGAAVALPEGTGSEEATRRFFEAVLRKEWVQAYEVLHHDSKREYPPHRFAALAEQYRSNLGFEPVEVRIRSCQEHGSEATAHVVLVSRGDSPSRSYKDGVLLRRSDSGWGVVLQRTFGRVAPKS